MIRSTPLKRDASSDINFKGISNANNDELPNIKQKYGDINPIQKSKISQIFYAN
jgi:hypothetical protein